MIGIVEQADATPVQRAIHEVNAGVYAFDVAALRSTLSRLRPTTPAGALPHRRDLDRALRRAGRAGRHVDDRARRRYQRPVQLAELGAELTGASSPRSAAG